MKSDHLEILSAAATVSSDIWTDVHNQVQAALARLEAEVVARVGGVRVVGGRTQGTAYSLFSYRTFSIPGSPIDPVVAGVTFSANELDVTMDADASGEQIGDIIFSVPATTVANSRQLLLDAAVCLAEKLCEAAAAIAEALGDDSRTVG